MKPPSNVGVIPNSERDVGHVYTRAICAHLQKRGYTPMLLPSAAFAAGMPEWASLENAFYREAIFIVVLGGDGTMLEVSHSAALHGASMLGINLGHLGYLTDVERDEGLAALDRALDGRCRREKRMMLTMGGPKTQELSGYDLLALNDVCLSRGAFGKLVVFELYINGVKMDTLRADGVLIATPTGSTAYNMSAGGPILVPDGAFIAVTPLCPHAPYARPWVVDAGDKIEIRAAAETPGPLTVALDGETRLTLTRGESLEIRRASYQASIIKTTDTSFYDILHKKIEILCKT